MLANHWRRRQIERAYFDTLAARSELLAPSPEERAIVLEAPVAQHRMLDVLRILQAFSAIAVAIAMRLTYY